MPLDLRRVVAKGALGLALGGLLTTGCRDDATPNKSVDAGAPAQVPSAFAKRAPGKEIDKTADAPAVQAVALDELARAENALEKLSPSSEDSHPEHQAFREAIAAGALLWRRRAPTACEILLGPVASVREAGGVVGMLDAALAAKDSREALKRQQEASRAILHLRHELTQSPLSRVAAGQALSLGAYDLGLRILGGHPGPPDSLTSEAADMRGALRGLMRTWEALQKDVGDTKPSDEVIAPLKALELALGDLTSAEALSGRASLVPHTGELGAALRVWLKSHDVEVRLPYAPRFPVRGGGIDEPVNALTLPAPRRSLDGQSSAENAALVKRGAGYFFDKRLSADGSRSCATCHDPSKYFTDGLARPQPLGKLKPGEPPLRHTPTLLYAPLMASQLWDGRRTTRSAQALGVLHSTAEMGVSAEQIQRAVGQSEKDVAGALSAFQEAKLVPGDAPLDRFVRGDATLSDEIILGLDVFSGKGRCARCHVPPSFGGVRPRGFSTPVYAVLGVPETSDGRAVDSDPGRFGVTKSRLDQGAFKTPTVRNAGKTAPYFHNGAFATLRDVVNFYNQGGPAQWKLDVADLDPDVRPLDLSQKQIDDLITFIDEGLLDATDPTTIASPWKDN